MQRLELKATHKPVQNYYAALRQFDDLGVTHETAVLSAFPGMLGDRTLVLERKGPFSLPLILHSAVAAFGAKAKAKLSNPGASGEPEDQLRAPFEQLLVDLAELCSLSKTAVAAVGESSVSDLKTRPDYSVTVHKALVGFVELKAPGKGADPKKFKDPHDKAQWEKLKSLPNLMTQTAMNSAFGGMASRSARYSPSRATSRPLERSWHQPRAFTPCSKASW